jgi:hypothetical protein
MKYLICILIFLGFTTSLFSQDSIKIRTEIDTFSTPQYKSDYDAFFLKQEPKKFMFKVTSSSVLRDYGFLSSGFGFIPEFRLAPGVSLNLAFFSQIYFIRGARIEKENSFNIPIQLYLEPRYYFNKRKEIAKKESADNLIGAYTGLRTGVVAGPNVKGETYFAEAVLGSQNLFFLKTNRGLYKDFVDFNVGLGAAYNTTTKWAPSYHLQVQLGGFFENLGTRNKNNAIPAVCDVFQCFVQEKRMFRVDLMNLLSIQDANNFDGGVDVNYEEKIAQSVFSVTAGLAGRGYNFKINSKNNAQIKGYSYKAYVEPRWYFKMKKEMANGTSANNLSGEYFALQLGYQNNERNNYENSALKTINKNDYFYSYLVFGQQQRILKHFYIETKFGLGVKSKKNLDALILNNGKNGGTYVGGFLEIKLGLAF